MVSGVKGNAGVTSFNQGARLAADIPRHRDARRPLPRNASVLWL
jgi:hypothetical protein